MDKCFQDFLKKKNLCSKYAKVNMQICLLQFESVLENEKVWESVHYCRCSLSIERLIPKL